MKRILLVLEDKDHAELSRKKGSQTWEEFFLTKILEVKEGQRKK